MRRLQITVEIKQTEEVIASNILEECIAALEKILEPISTLTDVLLTSRFEDPTVDYSKPQTYSLAACPYCGCRKWYACWSIGNSICDECSKEFVTVVCDGEIRTYPIWQRPIS